MWLLMHFLENMKMKGSFFLSPSLYQIGSKLFARNGYTIPILQLQSNSPISPGYSWLNDELEYKGHFYLSKQSKLKSTVHSELHAHDPKSSHLIQQLQSNSPISPGYSWLNDELRYKGSLYLSKQSKLKFTVLSEVHATSNAGHCGFTKTYDPTLKNQKCLIICG
jgi:uncharacterized protein YhjY with autotransporter beta-barrel domain